jgi:phage gp45-like
MLDNLTPSRIISAALDALNTIYVALEDYDETLIQNVRLWQQMGVRSMPAAGSTPEVLWAGYGDSADAVTAMDRKVLKAMGSIAAGETQIHSVDGSPQSISLKSSEIKIGNTASAAAAREGDTVDCGTIELAVVMGALVGTYTDPTGTTTPITAGKPFSITGKISSGSSLVKVQ